ncbi:MAG: hypothetical protein JXR77_07980 [Lentisphaeria bacterium]|nr:hypothetical protein [Lentisphaeria bacterium]
MKAFGIVALSAVLVLFLAGCATLWGPSEAGRALAGALADKEIDAATRQRIVQDLPLTLDDIKAVARADVPDDLIIAQIHATRSVYQLNTAQVLDLHGAGVSEKVIDFMLETPTAYALPPPCPAYGYPYWPFPPTYRFHRYPYW